MSMKEKIYYFLVFILCVVSIVFAVIDFDRGLTRPEMIIDWIIYAMFVVDYFVRFILAKPKMKFVRSNVFDLLAIIPFNSAFRAFRLFRFVKLLRLMRLFRIGALSGRLLSRSSRFFDTNGFKYVLVVSAAAIFLAAVAISYFEHMSFQDALWWSFVTATTVGYGDISPASGIGRIIACMLMLVGIGLIGSLTSTITSFFFRSGAEPAADLERVALAVSIFENMTVAERSEFLKFVGCDGYEKTIKK